MKAEGLRHVIEISNVMCFFFFFFFLISAIFKLETKHLPGSELLTKVLSFDNDHEPNLLKASMVSYLPPISIFPQGILGAGNTGILCP